VSKKIKNQTNSQKKYSPQDKNQHHIKIISRPFSFIFQFEFLVTRLNQKAHPDHADIFRQCSGRFISPGRDGLNTLFNNRVRAVTQPQFRVPLNVLADPLKPECRIGM